MRRSVVGAREIAAAEAPDACVASHHATQSEGVRMVAAAKSQPGDYFTRRQLGWIALDEVVLGTGTAFCRYRAVQFRALVAKAYRAAQKVFCVSRHNLDLLECQIGEPLPNAVIVWNPYNVSPNEPPPWPQGNICKLACVARLEPAAKGQDVLLKALAQPQWRNRAAELNLYGAGPFEHSLRQLVERLQLRNVHFRGHIADVNAIWEQNHILVLPSRLEGLPLSLVEAMFCARPAIVTDVGGNAELCVDGETGFVAAAPALSLLEQTLERAWNHRDEWQRMGMAPRELVQRVVPKDPVGDFCGEILKCASSGQTAAVCEQRSSNLSTE